MAKWEQGFKGEGRRTAGGVVEVIQAQEEWDRTGAQNEQVAHQQEMSRRKERLCPVRTEPGSMIGFTPRTIQFRISVEGGALILELCPGLTSTVGRSDSGLLKRERK